MGRSVSHCYIKAQGLKNMRRGCFLCRGGQLQLGGLQLQLGKLLI